MERLGLDALIFGEVLLDLFVLEICTCGFVCVDLVDNLVFLFFPSFNPGIFTFQFFGLIG